MTIVNHSQNDVMLHQTKLQLLRTVKLFAELDYVSKAKSYDIFGYLGLIFLKFLKINLGRKGLRVSVFCAGWQRVNLICIQSPLTARCFMRS